MKWLVIFFVCAVASTSMSGPIYAEECVEKGTWINSNDYKDNNLVLAVSKLGRGVTNIAFGVVEIPKQTVKRAIDTGCPSGFVSGVIIGVGFFMLRELAGVYEVVTFPVPIPAHYEPVIDPLLGYWPKGIVQ